MGKMHKNLLLFRQKHRHSSWAIHHRIIASIFKNKFEYLTALLAMMSIFLSCYFAFTTKRSSDRMETISKVILYSINEEFADTMGLDISNIEDPVLFAEMWIALKSENQKLINEKIAEYEKKHPDNPYTYFILGWYAQLNGNSESAKIYYSKSIELYANYAIAYNNRGYSKYLLGEYDSALIDYNKAIELTPNYAEAYNSRGILKFSKKEYDGAIIDFSVAIELNPSYAMAYNNLAGVKIAKGDYDGAIADYSKAIELTPYYAAAYNNRGYAKREKGDYDGAIMDFSIAIELNPDFAKAYNNRGYAKYKKSDWDGAITDYTKSIELKNPELWIPYCNRGIAKYEQNDYNDAISDLSKAIELKSDYAPAYKYRASAKRKNGDEKGAESDFKAAKMLENGTTK